MVKAFKPKPNDIHLFERHCVLFFKKGRGIFQVDFRNYQFESYKAVFFSPGQYFQLLAGEVEMEILEFPDNLIEQIKDSRFLFKHLVSLGYVDLEEQKHIDQDLTGYHPELLQNSIREWVHQNPFRANSKEVNLLFDLKELVDDRFREPLSLQTVSYTLDERPYRINELTKEKLQATVKRLSQQKVLLEAKRKVAFTNFSTKEIAYDLGFSEPQYFNRFFKVNTTTTPHEFRKRFEFERDSLLKDLDELISLYYRTQHMISFYAEKLNLSGKTLARKVKEETGISVHHMITKRLLQESKELLLKEYPINQIAFDLGFKEAHHFSSFFKKNTGKTPSIFKEEKLLFSH